MHSPWQLTSNVRELGYRAKRIVVEVHLQFLNLGKDEGFGMMTAAMLVNMVLGNGFPVVQT